MTEKSERNQQQTSSLLHACPVAIIGMASIFPGAKNLQDYWDNILEKVCSITEIPPSRWNVNEYYDADPSKPDKTYCKVGGFIPDIEFDPTEYGLPPNILEATDVSQLLALAVAKEALDDAGYGEEVQFDRQRAGVILGVVGISMKLFSPMIARLQYPVWEKVLTHSGISTEDTQKIIEKIKLAYSGWEENTFPGMIGNVIAGRIANRFNLGGMNCTVDAACGSSLAAVKTAVSELVERRADLMISGGVDLDNSIGTYLCFSKTPAFSKIGISRPFDDSADGMLAGEGIGMVILKRLEDAQRDNDRIYAVIKGIGSSSDGRFKSIYAPRAEGQANAIRRAYQEAKFKPGSIGLIEAHGTGTLAGDPEEVKGIKLAIGDEHNGTRTIALGSVKSQIGHTKATAGTASLIKTSLALYHKVLPPTINVDLPNQKMEIENSPLYINTETRPWIRNGEIPRRAGVSAFGFGGTNFHVAMEEYTTDHCGAYRLNTTAKSVILSALTPDSLVSVCQETMEKFQTENAKIYLNELSALSSDAEIPLHYARFGFVTDSIPEAIEQLQTAINLMKEKPEAEEWEHPKGIFYRKSGFYAPGTVVALFSGQGSQYLEMGRELALNFPVVRETFFEMDDLMRKNGNVPISDVVYPPPVFDKNEKTEIGKVLQNTENAQPAIGTFSAALMRTFTQAGFKADITAGHSFGELGALWAAGVFNDEDFFYLVRARGKAMAAPKDSNIDAGTMLAVKGDAEAVKSIMKEYPDITIANYNSNNQLVLAGRKTDVMQIQQVLSENGFSPMPLSVSAAFHTALVKHAQEPFAEVLKSVKFNTPVIPVFSNTTGKAHSNKPAMIRKVMLDHILNPVLFKDEIENIYESGGRIFVEFGPKNVVTNLVHNILNDKPHIAVALNGNVKKNSDRQLREAFIQLKVAGIPLTNIDPYQQPDKNLSPRKKKMSILLNGGLYMSDKTRNAFQQALAETDPINLIHSTQNINADALTDKSVQQTPSFSNSKAASSEIAAYKNSSMIGKPNIHIEEIIPVNTDMIQLHEKFLHNQAEYTRVFSQLVQSQINLISDISISPDKLDKISPLLDQLGKHFEKLSELQTASLNAHIQFFKKQNETQLVSKHPEIKEAGEIETYPSILPGEESSPPTSEPDKSLSKTMPANENAKKGNGHHKSSSSISKENSSNIDENVNPDDITYKIKEIVSEKTGYPPEMLEPDMDMESDLGIDSIKRVEIISALREKYPDMPKIETEQFSEIRSLKHIIDFIIVNTLPGKTKISSQSTKIELPQQIQPDIPALPIVDNDSTKNIMDTMIGIVSEKTGYPVEMLELDMDMESDLGIDSIKRVEIIAALREQYPQLPKIEAEQFAELRTLQQICDFLNESTTKKVLAEPDTLYDIESLITPESVFKAEQVILTTLPAPDWLEFNIPDNHICLITDDGTNLTPQLAEEMSERFGKVIVLSFPQTIVDSQMPLSKNISRYILENMKEGHLQEQIMNILSKHGQIAVFIHLNPRNDMQNDEDINFSEKQKQITKHVFLLAKHLKETLSTVAYNSRSAFMTITHLDGLLGLGENPDFEPVEGGLFGLVKTLNLEWDTVFCRAVDLSPDLDDETSILNILAELHDANLCLTEVGYNRQGRFTLGINSGIEKEGIS